MHNMGMSAQLVELTDDLFRLCLAHQNEQCRCAVPDLLAHLPDEIIADSVVTEVALQRAHASAGHAPYHEACQRVEENQAEQRASERTRRKTARKTQGRQIDRLIQMHFAVAGATDNHGIRKVDQIFFFQCRALGTGSSGTIFGVKTDNNKI